MATDLLPTLSLSLLWTGSTPSAYLIPSDSLSHTHTRISWSRLLFSVCVLPSLSPPTSSTPPRIAPNHDTLTTHRVRVGVRRHRAAARPPPTHPPPPHKKAAPPL